MTAWSSRQQHEAFAFSVPLPGMQASPVATEVGESMDVWVKQDWQCWSPMAARWGFIILVCSFLCLFQIFHERS